jgi:AcrR family transcriptional regulator
MANRIGLHTPRGLERWGWPLNLVGSEPVQLGGEIMHGGTREMKNAPLAAKRPRAGAKSLSFEAVAEAALEILRDEGPSALSLRRVGELLSTNHVAVYRRCGSFDGLLDMCADYIARDFPSVPDGLDWARGTQMRFEAAFDMWAEHADLILLMRGRAWLGVNMTSRFYEPAMRGIVDSGLPIAEVSVLFSTLYRLTIGSVITTRANHWTPGESGDALEHLGIDRFPTLAKINEEVDYSDDRGSFCAALRRIIVNFGRASRGGNDGNGPALTRT